MGWPKHHPGNNKKNLGADVHLAVDWKIDYDYDDDIKITHISKYGKNVKSIFLYQISLDATKHVRFDPCLSYELKRCTTWAIVHKIPTKIDDKIENQTKCANICEFNSESCVSNEKSLLEFNKYKILLNHYYKFMMIR